MTFKAVPSISPFLKIWQEVYFKTPLLLPQQKGEGWYTTVNCPQNYVDFDQSTSLEVRANFLDISKDFDKVWHKELLYKNLKLSKFGNLQNLCFQIL